MCVTETVNRYVLGLHLGVWDMNCGSCPEIENHNFKN